MRPLYAAFLDEAAALLGRKELGALAERYRELGRRWTAFADFVLPAEFGDLKKAMRQYAAGDLKQKDRIGKAELKWDDARILAHLDEASGRLAELYEGERAAAEELGRVVGII